MSAALARRPTWILAALSGCYLLLSSAPAHAAFVWRYVGTFTELAQQFGDPAPIGVGDSFSLEIRVGGSYKLDLGFQVDEGFGILEGGDIVGGPGDDLSFGFEGPPNLFWTASGGLLFGDRHEPFPSPFPDATPDPADFARSSFDLALFQTGTGGSTHLLSTNIAVPEPKPLALLMGLTAAIIFAAYRRSAKRHTHWYIGTTILLTFVPAIALPAVSRCTPMLPPPVHPNCGTGTGGLSTGDQKCVTVVVMNDTQFHVNLDPAFAAVDLNTSGTADLLNHYITWILQNAASSKENIGFLLQTGDLVQAGDRGSFNHSTPLLAQCLQAPNNVSGQGNIGGVDGCANHGNVTTSNQNPPINLNSSGSFPGCGCWEFFNINDEWELLSGAFHQLDGSVPWALVAGNHDNVGFLAGESSEMLARERDGFNQWFSPAVLDQALASFPDFKRIDKFEVPEAGAITVLPPAPPLDQRYLRGRGVSHAWEFRLGPHPIGVLGLDYLFGEGVSSYNENAFGWANGLIDTRFRRRPALSHQWFNMFAAPNAPLNAREAWKKVVAPSAPKLQKQVFWTAEGHHDNSTAILLDRDQGRLDDDDYKVIYTRSPGQGLFGQIFLVRFLFRTLQSNIAALKGQAGGVHDEIEIFSLPFHNEVNVLTVTMNGVSSSEWHSSQCTSFSIFYDDRDYDGRKDHVDNCPMIFNPAQTDANGDTYGDDFADLNGDGKLDGGDLVIAQGLVAGTIVDPVKAALADVAPPPGDGRVDAADLVVLLSAVAGTPQGPQGPCMASPF